MLIALCYLSSCAVGHKCALRLRLLTNRLRPIFQGISSSVSATIRGRDNKSLEPTGISLPLIDNLPLAQLSPGGSAPALACY